MQINIWRDSIVYNFKCFLHKSHRNACSWTFLLLRYANQCESKYKLKWKSEFYAVILVADEFSDHLSDRFGCDITFTSFAISRLRHKFSVQGNALKWNVHSFKFMDLICVFFACISFSLKTTTKVNWNGFFCLFWFYWFFVSFHRRFFPVKNSFDMNISQINS